MEYGVCCGWSHLGCPFWGPFWCCFGPYSLGRLIGEFRVFNWKWSGIRATYPLLGVQITQLNSLYSDHFRPRICPKRYHARAGYNIRVGSPTRPDPVTRPRTPPDPRPRDPRSDPWTPKMTPKWTIWSTRSTRSQIPF